MVGKCPVVVVVAVVVIAVRDVSLPLTCACGGSCNCLHLIRQEEESDPMLKCKKGKFG